MAPFQYGRSVDRHDALDVRIGGRGEELLSAGGRPAVSRVQGWSWASAAAATRRPTSCCISSERGLGTRPLHRGRSQRCPDRRGYARRPHRGVPRAVPHRLTSAADRAQEVIGVLRRAQSAHLQPGTVGEREPEGGVPAWLARLALDPGLSRVNSVTVRKSSALVGDSRRRGDAATQMRSRVSMTRRFGLGECPYQRSSSWPAVRFQSPSKTPLAGSCPRSL